MPKQLVHAQLKNPILVRKTLLESAILTTEILKSYQKIKKIRTQKQKFKTQLKKDLQEIKQLVEKLEIHELPRPPQIPHSHKSPVIKKELKKEVKEQIKQERLLNHEHSELDSELKKLQDKLKNL